MVPAPPGGIGRLLVDIGRDAEAREVFDEMSKDEFRMFYPDSEWLFGISIVSETCALLSDVGAAATLYGQLEPLPDGTRSDMQRGAWGPSTAISVC